MPSFDVNSTDNDVLNKFNAKAKRKTFLITGPSQAAIGGQVSISLASALPKLFILAGRNESKIRPDMEEIQKTGSKLTPKARQNLLNFTNSVMTRQFAVSYSGYFLLTNLLFDEGIVSYGNDVLKVGSLGYQVLDIHLEDINFKTYGQAKSAQRLETRDLANHLRGRNITAFVAHAGVSLEGQLLANSTIDQDYFDEAKMLALEKKQRQNVANPKFGITQGDRRRGPLCGIEPKAQGDG
ncbi:hypothetical protein K504DRAFT_495430 [Pleomassaria siparia CBS 279.74]|uniref:NAD(P)-binding protein n=1 Tax=Pleomassaria siparia CBS 279.74 TaxID=1314801 RepID=A0A6G1JSY4_9PLEO|nr:hypothetical protein K504DRAFT_495430 [Pleomassaria siparia CBS 279.74]